MRKIRIVVLIFMISGSFTVQSQTVDNVPLSEINVTYIEFTEIGKVFSPKVRIQVDFGQDRSRGRINESQITDSDGRVIEFNSLVDALNFFDQLGYEFLEGNRSHIERVNIDQYLLRKKKTLLDSANIPRQN
ncbi:hypothetical protein [Algoriphagus antarcticus]|uniref:Uncharacterized protein n=1 Tax=Algoriphagus antarcticus TaxID=238540 RepID=A0A3E0E4X9_9BACT|nr:hypothetical protein [Algoriphagus antarcticus]REG92670.1 hypothetical protein C8N25_10270 [Algoriphagus antarcticus]